MKKIQNAVSVILAAGKGTRMKSDINKLLHEISGKPLVRYVADTVIEAGIENNIFVVGENKNEIKKELGDKFKYVVQEKPLGTGHAFNAAKSLLEGFSGDVCVFSGDTPFLTSKIVRNLIQKHRRTNADATLITTIFPETPLYGRIVRDSTGKIIRIVEAIDSTNDELKIREVNTSHYCFKADIVLPLLSEIKNKNIYKEYYLTDIIEILATRKRKIENLLADDYHIVFGINNREDLSFALKLMYKRKNIELMKTGVSIIDPSSTYIDNTVKIGIDTTIYPFTFIEKNSKLGSDCVIGPFVKITNSKIGKECQIQYASIDNSKLAEGSVLGPFASLKNGEIQENNKTPFIP
ncbi:NTP transferase domain-containing protein [candidate division KSB1 bacterium]